MNRDTATLITMAFGFGFFMAWGFFYQPIVINERVSDQFPAWVQAFGSIIGIGVAIAVPYKIHKREQQAATKGKRLRERSYMLYLLPMVSRLQGELNNALEIVSDWDVPDYPDFITAANIASIPAELSSQLIQLHEIGPPAERLQAALAQLPDLVRHLNYADAYYSRQGKYEDLTTGDEEIMDAVAPYEHLLAKARDDLQSAVTEMRAALQVDSET